MSRCEQEVSRYECEGELECGVVHTGESAWAKDRRKIGVTHHDDHPKRLFTSRVDSEECVARQFAGLDRVPRRQRSHRFGRARRSLPQALATGILADCP